MKDPKYKFNFVTYILDHMLTNNKYYRSSIWINEDGWKIKVK